MIRKFENSDIDDIMQIWQNENIKAVKFYQKNGFKIVKNTVDKETNEKGYLMLWNL